MSWHVLCRDLRVRCADWSSAVVISTLLLTLIGCDNPAVVRQAAPTSTPTIVSAPAPQEPYKIGLLVSLSGPYASAGVPARDAVQLAVNEVNAQGGIAGRNVQLVVEDDQGDASQAGIALKDFVDQNVDAIIGPTNATIAAAVVALDDEARVPMLSLADDNRQATPVRQFVFQIAPSPDIQANGVLSYLQRRNIGAAALLREISDFGTSGHDYLVKDASRFGVRIVVEDTVQLGDTDLSQQVGEVKNNASVGALIGWLSLGSDAASLVRQARQMDVSVPILLTSNQANPSFLQAAGSSADGIFLESTKFVVADYLLPTDPSRQKALRFASAYQQATGRPPGRVAALAYDAEQILADAMGRTGADADSLSRQLENTRFDGVNGPYAFSRSNHAGMQSAALLIVTVQGGAFVPTQLNCDGCAETTITQH